MSEATLIARMSLDGDKFNRSIDGAKGKAKDFEQALGKSRQGIESTTKTIEGMSKATEGGISGAVGAVKGFLELLATNPPLALFAGIAAGVTMAAKAWEQYEEKRSEAMAGDVKAAGDAGKAFRKANKIGADASTEGMSKDEAAVELQKAEQEKARLNTEYARLNDINLADAEPDAIKAHADALASLAKQLTATDAAISKYGAAVEKAYDAEAKAREAAAKSEAKDREFADALAKQAADREAAAGGDKVAALEERKKAIVEGMWENRSTMTPEENAKATLEVGEIDSAIAAERQRREREQADADKRVADLEEKNAMIGLEGQAKIEALRRQKAAADADVMMNGPGEKNETLIRARELANELKQAEADRAKAERAADAERQKAAADYEDKAQEINAKRYSTPFDAVDAMTRVGAHFGGRNVGDMRRASADEQRHRDMLRAYDRMTHALEAIDRKLDGGG